MCMFIDYPVEAALQQAAPAGAAKDENVQSQTTHMTSAGSHESDGSDQKRSTQAMNDAMHKSAHKTPQAPAQPTCMSRWCYFFLNYNHVSFKPLYFLVSFKSFKHFCYSLEEERTCGPFALGIIFELI